MKSFFNFSVKRKLKTVHKLLKTQFSPSSIIDQTTQQNRDKIIIEMSTSTKARDKPSTTFEADQWLNLLIDEQDKPGKLFGVVLVANWPPRQSFTEPYEKILPKLKLCFDAQDYEINDKDLPAAYFYPKDTLHITIASFIPHHAPVVANKEEYSKACIDVMNKSFAREDWPKEAFHVEFDRAQIGSKAGIFLWNNFDGTIAKMRKIIQEEYDSHYEKDSKALNDRSLIVPDIIHSTFLRFGSVPETDGNIVQERFIEATKDLARIFGKIGVYCTRLVIERTPYMHIPYDEEHLLTSFES